MSYSYFMYFLYITLLFSDFLFPLGLTQCIGKVKIWLESNDPFLC